MAEKMSEVYEAYEMNVLQSMRGRGAIILKTDKGIYQLRTPEVNESRLMAEYIFKESMYEEGFTRIDRSIKNKEGELFTFDRYGNPYVLRTYYEGRDCNIQNREEILQAVDNLASMHKASKIVFEKSESDVHIRMSNDFKKRNAEMNRVMNFLKKRKGKIDFEEKLLKIFPKYYEQAINCEKEYKERVGTNQTKHLGYCHGMYDYHSLILLADNQFATVNFDRFYVGNQLADLYHFIRKVVEKNDYSSELAKTILQKYSEQISLYQEDYQYIFMMYKYPEKFYKLVNQYINSSKNRISPKMYEKLDKIIENESKKQIFLKEFM